ncbi:Replication polyprotein [Talaromyces islandicus]|uniref:Replication polyprotein n=1 Tax=Talaromyces islandicus TaxID=28573 RepID=A0A0U1LYZ9_TALIS|nr:Replication polyprotein [Talaromyces islandicus]
MSLNPSKRTLKMPGTTGLSTTLAHRKRRYQDISDTNNAAVTPSVSDSDSVGRRPSKQATPRKKGQDNMTYIVGLDFGTTMTSISYYSFKSGKRPAKVPQSKIKDITHWPLSGRDQRRGEVPSESVYLAGKYYWGYQARKQLEQFRYGGGTSGLANRLIRFTKLLLTDPELSEEDETDDQLREVRQTLRHLGKTVYDVVQDYLVEVFRWAKKYLTDEVNFTESSEVELSLSVPAGWSIEASWSLQQIVREATTKTTFGQPSSFFIINEPEAASAFLLDHVVVGTNVSRGETFMVCDAGGGTVDVTTYTVEHKSPFRLKEEVPPHGGNFGSTCVNRAMESDLLEDLKTEPCFSRNKTSMERQLFHKLFPKFEDEVKRNFDYENSEKFLLELNGLEENPSKGFGKDTITLERDRVKRWFVPSLEGIAGLIQQQLDACKAINRRVQSKTLQSFLKQRFSHPRVMTPRADVYETTVSRGAVYRAIDKSKGPMRYTTANIGILQTEEHDRKRIAAHREFQGDRNNLDRKKYVYDAVQWIIKKGQLAGYNESVQESNHRLIPIGEPWEIKQSIYYNPLIENPQDHYPVDHLNNKGSQWADTVVFDITSAQEQHPLKIKGEGAKMHYDVHYDLLVELQGRNLKVSVVYPRGGKVQGTKDIAVAACFRPGTE